MKAYRMVWSVVVVLVMIALGAGPALAQDNVPPGASKRPAYYVEFNGASSVINAGADASLADLHAGTFTVDAWVRSHDWNNSGSIAYKTNNATGGPFNGWMFHYDYSGALTGYVAILDDLGRAQAATSHYDPLLAANAWHHVVMTFEAETGKVWLAADGVWAPSYQWQEAQIGPPSSDVNQPLLIGTLLDQRYWFDGDISWLRISRGARYAIGAPFTPPDVRAAPRVDAATVELWGLDDGHGDVARAEVERANNGVLTDATWVRWPK